MLQASVGSPGEAEGARGRRAPSVANTGGSGYVEVTEAYIADDGRAVAPADAPAEVKAIIAAGNEIHDKPYRYGGGHGKWKDSGYDCSGSMSYALHGAGLLDTSMDSTGFMSWGSRGPRHVGDHLRPRRPHLHGGGRPALRHERRHASAAGSRWTDEWRSPKGFTVRHPPGL